MRRIRGTVLGAVAQATEQVEALHPYVILPDHVVTTPAVVAQKAATLQILADGRFTLGVGSGENLNEHVVGGRWPTVSRRQQMLKEAIQIIRELFTGDLVDWQGDYFEVDSARIWDISRDPCRHRHRGVRRSLGRHVRAAVRPLDRRFRTEQGPRRRLARRAEGDRAAPATSG